MNIRAATEDDLSGILTVLNHHILHSTAIWSEAPFTWLELLEWYHARVDVGYPVVVAVSEDQTVLGYGTYAMFRPKSGYRFCVEHSLYVNPNVHNKGIGTGIITALITQAKAQGLHTMVGVIEATNVQSIQFHEKFGFEITGRLPEAGFKFNRWLDLVFMQLKISS
ncbi:MAG: GNAT family N-acetyltransferase [Flavobacteriales bacterium]|nr:GNAT family N-acetyltransferase [Flavobacteriales bacterium]